MRYFYTICCCFHSTLIRKKKICKNKCVICISTRCSVCLFFCLLKRAAQQKQAKKKELNRLMRWKYAFINYLFDRLFQERFVVRRVYDPVHSQSVSFVSPKRGGLFFRLVFYSFIFFYTQKLLWKQMASHWISRGVTVFGLAWSAMPNEKYSRTKINHGYSCENDWTEMTREMENRQHSRILVILWWMWHFLFTCIGLDLLMLTLCVLKCSSINCILLFCPFLRNQRQQYAFSIEMIITVCTA